MILKKFGPITCLRSVLRFPLQQATTLIGDRTARDHRGDLSRPTVKHALNTARCRRSDEPPLSDWSGGEPRRQSDLRDWSSWPQPRAAASGNVHHGLNIHLSAQPPDPAYGTNMHLKSCQNRLRQGRPVRYVESGIHRDRLQPRRIPLRQRTSPPQAYLNDVSIAKPPRPNGAFLEFINAADTRIRFSGIGGMDGVNREKVTSPLYWHNRDGEWNNSLLAACVNCRCTHPSDISPTKRDQPSPNGKGCVCRHELVGSSERKVRWACGWEWTNSAYLPYPALRNRTDPWANTMASHDEPNVLRGASVVP